MTEAEKKAYKAKQLRYKKPIARDLNIETIQSELWDMMSACEDIHWYDNDEESLVHALDGDEDEAYEFKMAFSDLEAELEQFQGDLDSEYVSDYFDVLFPAVKASYAGGYLGFDQYEGDIVKRKIFDDYVIGQVVWIDIGFCGFMLKCGNRYYHTGKSEHTGISDCDEVIGNVHENADLLEEV